MCYEKQGAISQKNCSTMIARTIVEMQGTGPSKCNAQAARCTGGVLKSEGK
jgi:hypothetical protein